MTNILDNNESNNLSNTQDFTRINNDEEKCLKLFEDMIGNNIQYDSPIRNENNEIYKKFLIYADFTASGKALKSIENFISKEIFPTYANVHSTVGLCAEKTAKYFEQGKDILRDYVEANGNYSIIFHGQGATGGVHKLIEIISIKKYESFYTLLETTYQIKEKFMNDTNGEEKFLDICQNLITQIEEKFKELFLDINFCFKIKENGKCKTICVLCNEEFSCEGGYNEHINKEIHKQKKENYNKYPDTELFRFHKYNIIYDFIDIIRKNYLNENNYILKMINDYKKFKPVVFFSLFEHNSNSLSWKSTKCETVIIDEEIDNDFYSKLESKLIDYNDRYIKIGSFTACSNITGLLLDIDRISIIMHRYNGFAFFDYAAGGPYLQINASGPLPDEYRDLLKFKKLNDYEKEVCFKDGLFFSPHKFIGGPNTPGVLIVHDRIYRNQLKPSQPGGGTVHFVYKDFIKYIQDVELKEESGTPNIIGSIRVGLMINLRNQISHSFIIKRDEYYNELFRSELEEIPNLYILHNKYLKDKPHLPIYSFMISYKEKFLHPNFICALLNDLFGIQTRPGCSCAPNYAKLLLGFDKDESKLDLLQKLIYNGYEIFKPGYCRLNLPYFYPEYIIRYIIKCIKFICQFGHQFLGLYDYDVKTAKFSFHDYKINLMDLSKFNINQGNTMRLYIDRHFKIISEFELNQVYDNVFNYLKYQLIKESFIIKENEIIPKIQEYDYNENENVRWFLTFNDVQNFLVTIYKSMFFENIDDNLNQYYEKDKVRKIIRMKNWSIKDQME